MGKVKPQILKDKRFKHLFKTQKVKVFFHNKVDKKKAWLLEEIFNYMWEDTHREYLFGKHPNTK